MVTEDVKNDTLEAATQAEAAQPDYKELFLRTNADLQNFKKRVEREKTEWAQVVQADVIEKLIPVLEDLDRALDAAVKNTSTEATSLVEGFKLIQKNLQKKLAEMGVEEVKAEGMFNPELHEALMQVESTAHESGTIVSLLSKGYTLKGKVIKYARVSVAK